MPERDPQDDNPQDDKQPAAEHPAVSPGEDPGAEAPTEPVWIAPPPPTVGGPEGIWMSGPPEGGHGWAPPPPPAPGPPTSPKWRRLGVAATVVALVAVSGGLGAVLGVAVHDRSTGSGSVLPDIPSTGGSPGVGATSGIDAGTVAGKVDPAVVDINTTLAGGGEAAGTGMVLTSGGLVLTNNHVIRDAETIRAQVAGEGRTYTGKVVGYDVLDDVAVVQLEAASGLKTVSLGNASSLSVGTPVVAIGNALGQGGTPEASEGTVTALNQTITVQGDISAGETLHGLIQFNAPIQSGDSGGPLVDANARVVGMDTAAAFGGGRFGRQLSPSDAGYAIPIETAIRIAKQITAGNTGGNIHIGPRPLLGVEVGDVGSGSDFGGGSGGGGFEGTAPVSSGALVVGVNDGTPAASAGIRSGDVIVGIGGQSIANSSDLSSAILDHKVGDTVKVTWVDQSGGRHTASITFTAGPPA